MLPIPSPRNDVGHDDSFDKARASDLPVWARPLAIPDANAVLAGGRYGLHVNPGGPQPLLRGPGTGSGVPLREPLTLLRLCRPLIRLRRTRLHPDRSWLTELNRQLEPDGHSVLEHRTRRPEHTAQQAGVLAADPLLRMHCAVVDNDASGRLRPEHPKHPGGTLAVTSQALERADASDNLLAHVVGARPVRSESDVDYFAEFFVRPLARTFRMALEHHRIGLLATHEAAVAFELSPEFGATGRVVVTGPFRDHDELDDADVHAGATRVADIVGTLCRLHEANSANPEAVRPAAEQVLAAELRHLSSDIAELLDSTHRLRPWVHSVPPTQDASVQRVLRAVQDATRRRRHDPSVGRPTVLVDLDAAGSAAGFAQFTWDVRDAGGRAVFHRGSPAPRALLQADEEVLAVVTKNATSPEAAEFPNAITVPVATDGSSPDALTGLETTPRRAPGQSLLSHTHSLAELPLTDMRPNRVAPDWAVHLGRDESLSVVETVLTDVDASAQRTARNALARQQHDDPSERIIAAVRHVLTRKQFRKGPQANYRPEHAHQDMSGFVRRGEPIDTVLPSFPIKQCLNGLKASGPLPDLAELGALARLRELQEAVRGVYPPGLRLHVLTDGRHFRSRPAPSIEAYTRKLRHYAELVGLGSQVIIRDIDDLARERIGPHLPEQRRSFFELHRARLHAALEDLDITDDPRRTLSLVEARAERTSCPHTRQAMQALGGILSSVIYSVPVPDRSGREHSAWSQEVFADPYEVDTALVGQQLASTRRVLLRRTWQEVIDYLAVVRTDESLGYDLLLPNHVRLTINSGRSGRCGFTYLGGSGLLPWQGTGAVDERGRLASDFLVSLLDQGFVPVYSALLGRRQPWLMVPASATEPAAGGARLDADFAATIRLRRK